jgi:hypothetical protein
MWLRVLRCYRCGWRNAGAEVLVAGGAVVEQVPDDDQDGAGDGDHGLELAAAPVALPEEGVSPAGRGGSLTEYSLEVGVALAVLPERFLAPDWTVCGADLSPGHRVAGG